MLRQAARFALTGVFLTGVHVLIAASLIGVVRVSAQSANAIAFIVATMLSYTINTLWSFSRPLQGHALIRFVVVSLFGLALTVAVAGSADAYGLNYWFGIAGVVCTVPPITFLLHRAWTYRQAEEDPALWLAVLSGLAVFVAITHGAVLDPRNTDWLLRTPDPATSFLGWQFFRQSPVLQLPFGANPNYGMEIGTSVVFTDSIPLLAFLFKPFARWLPHTFQYFGVWLLVSFVLQSVLAYMLLRRFSQNRWLALVGSGFFVVAPVWMARLEGHFALFGQWLVLGALYLYFAPRFSLLAWSLLLATSALVHFYFLAMVAFIWAGDLWQRRWRDEIKRGQAAMGLATGALVTLFILWFAGYFMIGDAAGEGGFGLYRMNLLSLVDPDGLWSRLLPDQPSLKSESEGFNYLGMGMLLLAGLACCAALAQQRQTTIDQRSVIPLLFVALVLTLLAMSNRVALGDVELLDYPIPELLKPGTDVLRSSGRMFWPVYYLIYLAILVFVFRRFTPRVGIGVCATLLAVQVADSFAALQHFNNRFVHPPAWSSPLRSPLWADIAKAYTRIIYVLPRNAMESFLPWAAFAADKGMAVNFGYFARVNAQKLAAARNSIETGILANELHPDSLYVFESDALWTVASARAGAADVAGVLDGVRIVAPKLKQCAACDLRALADVRPQQPDSYALGEPISFARGGSGQKYAAAGWLPPDNRGTWSYSALASLVVNLGHVPDRDLILAIEGRAFVNARHRSRQIDVSMNGVMLGTLTYAAPPTVEWKTLRIPRSVLSQAKGPLVIQFSFKNGDNDHPRLGLWLISLRLNAA